MFGVNPYNQYGYPPVQASQMQFYPQNQIPISQEARITVAQVPTIEQIDRVQMMPGERKIILVQDNPDFLAIRVADGAGFVKTEYRTSKVIDPKTLKDQIQYAPVQSVIELKKEVDKIKEAIGGGLNAESNSKPVSGSE